MPKKIFVEYKIDRGIPIPVKTKLPPLNELAINESVSFPIGKRASVQTTAYRLKRQTGKEFRVSKISESEARVWRVV